MTFDDVRAIALAWPGVEDSISYGTAALKVKGKFLTRLKEDGDSLVIKGVEFDERDMLIEADPEVFYITDHYRNWPTVLIRLSKAQRGTVESFLLRYWRIIAPKKFVREFEKDMRVAGSEVRSS
jgi:hypothetical protein